MLSEKPIYNIIRLYFESNNTESVGNLNFFFGFEQRMFFLIRKENLPYMTIII